MTAYPAIAEYAKQGGNLQLQPEQLAVPGWYVLWTRSNYERLVHDQLARKGYEVFLPQIQQWTPRKQGCRKEPSRIPLFKSYLFLNHAIDKDAYLDICKADGLVAILGSRWDRLARVPNKEIDAIKLAVDSHLPTMPYPYLEEGTKVRITQGSLANAEGILIKQEHARGLFILNVNLLRRSVAVEVHCADVVPA